MRKIESELKDLADMEILNIKKIDKQHVVAYDKKKDQEVQKIVEDYLLGGARKL